MPIKLKPKFWSDVTKPVLYSKYGVSEWESDMLRRYQKWCAEKALPIPPSIQLRIQMLVETDGKPPERNKNEGLRAYRRRVRRWRIAHYGSVSKKRRACKEQQLKEQRWQVLREQGLPLKEHEALLWFMRKQMFVKQTGSYWSSRGYRGYLNTGELAEIAGGALPPGIDFERAYRLEFTPASDKGQRRQRIADSGNKQWPKPKDHWPDKVLAAFKAAYGEAQFRHKHDKGFELALLPPMPGAKAFVNVVDTQPMAGGRRRRRGSHETTVHGSVFMSWYRKVYKSGLANAFGERTLVLDTYLTADGQRTVIVLFRQPGSRLYKTEVVHGYLSRDASGNPQFMEE